MSFFIWEMLMIYELLYDEVIYGCMCMSLVSTILQDPRLTQIVHIIDMVSRSIVYTTVVGASIDY